MEDYPKLMFLVTEDATRFASEWNIPGEFRGINDCRELSKRTLEESTRMATLSADIKEIRLVNFGGVDIRAGDSLMIVPGEHFGENPKATCLYAEKIEVIRDRRIATYYTTAH